ISIHIHFFEFLVRSNSPCILLLYCSIYSFLPHAFNMHLSFSDNIHVSLPSLNIGFSIVLYVLIFAILLIVLDLKTCFKGVMSEISMFYI
ncbi:hypothetical protein L9F63_018143, partial [Diploptera punctata]